MDRFRPPSVSALGTPVRSDLTDEEFALIEPMLPAAKRGGRRRTTSLHEVLNAILYLLRTGCPSAACWPRPFQGSDRWPPGHRLADAARRVPAALDRLPLLPPLLAVRHLGADLAGADDGGPRAGRQGGFAECRDNRQPERENH